EDAEEDDALEECFVELARMTRIGAAGREHHRPGHVGDAAPQLVIDEVRDAPEEEADRHGADDDVAEGEEVEAALPGEEQDGDDDAERAAMERHPAMPDLQDLEWMREIEIRLVEEDVAEPAAEHDADRRPGEEIVDIEGFGRDRRPPREAQAPAPAEDEPGDIGERLPADREGPQMHQHRVDDGV